VRWLIRARLRSQAQQSSGLTCSLPIATDFSPTAAKQLRKDTHCCCHFDRQGKALPIRFSVPSELPATGSATGCDGGAGPDMVRRLVTCPLGACMQIDLANRAAIVTGGSKGLGYAIASRFAASGADVLIAARGRDTLDAAVKSIGAGAKGRVVGARGD